MRKINYKTLAAAMIAIQIATRFRKLRRNRLK